MCTPFKTPQSYTVDRVVFELWMGGLSPREVIFLPTVWNVSDRVTSCPSFAREPSDSSIKPVDQLKP